MDDQAKSIVTFGGKPYKSYIKTILGRVYVQRWNSFENTAEGIILQGDQRKKEESSIVDVWTKEEDYYFRTKNKRQLETGTIVEFTRKEETREKTVEEYSDEELEALLNEKFKKFFSFQSLINETESIALLYRIQSVAREQERSEKIINAVTARIAEIQGAKESPQPVVVEI